MTELRKALEEVRLLEPRPRGRGFEKFLSKVFDKDRIRHRLSYRPVGEEIDGALWWSQRTFLLEAKWWSEPLPASAIYAFKGKIDGKFADTLGIFVSMSGYSEDCAKAVSHGKYLNILMFDGSDVEAIADGELFARLLEEKMFAAGQSGQIYVPWSELQQTHDIIENVKHEAAISSTSTDPTRIPLVVICEGPTDKLVLESLIQHVTKQDNIAFEPQFLVSQGKAPLLNNIAPSVVSLLSNGVSGPAAVLLAFDADTTDPLLIDQQRIRAIKILDGLPSGWKGFVAIAVPEIEEWIGIRLRGETSAKASNLAVVNWSEIASQEPEIAALIAFLRSVI